MLSVQNMPCVRVDDLGILKKLPALTSNDQFSHSYRISAATAVAAFTVVVRYDLIMITIEGIVPVALTVR